jgi:hypothetical protein
VYVLCVLLRAPQASDCDEQTGAGETPKRKHITYNRTSYCCCHQSYHSLTSHIHCNHSTDRTPATFLTTPSQNIRQQRIWGMNTWHSGYSTTLSKCRGHSAHDQLVMMYGTQQWSWPTETYHSIFVAKKRILCKASVRIPNSLTNSETSKCSKYMSAVKCVTIRESSSVCFCKQTTNNSH